MGEIRELFGVSDGAIYDIIKRFNIPKFQIGKFVYAPKEKIIEIFGYPENKDNK